MHLKEGEMKLSRLVTVAVLSSVASVGFACELPPLMAVPPKDEAAGQADKLRAEWDSYYQAMQAYTACVQAELAAAGGDTAPTITKTVLVQRNNSAVGEVSAVKKLLDAALLTVVPASEFSPAGGTPPPGGPTPEGDSGRRRNN
jgi:hypothetical protein